MYLLSTALPVLLLLFVFQAPQGGIRQHYEAAEADRRAGKLDAAESEYAAILAEAYGRLGKIYSAERRYHEAVESLEAAARYRPDSQDVLVDLSIAYFDARQHDKAPEPLARAAPPY